MHSWVINIKLHSDLILNDFTMNFKTQPEFSFLGFIKITL